MITNKVISWVGLDLNLVKDSQSRVEKERNEGGLKRSERRTISTSTPSSIELVEMSRIFCLVQMGILFNSFDQKSTDSLAIMYWLVKAIFTLFFSFCFSYPFVFYLSIRRFFGTPLFPSFDIF